jgi:SOUL heme-binding protein
MGMIFGKESVAEPSYKILHTCIKTATIPYEIRQYGDRYAIQTIYPMGASTSVPFRKLAQYIGVFGTPNNVDETTIAMTAPVSMSTTTTTTTTATKGDGKPIAIAMTAPVSMKAVTTTTTSDTASSLQETPQSHQVMTFYLPSIYNDQPNTIPKPLDTDVTIQCIPGAVGAVHRFSGTMDCTTARSRAVQLRQQLIQDGITTFPKLDHQDVDTTQEANHQMPLDFYEAWGYNPPFTIPAFRRNEIWIELTTQQVQQLIDTNHHPTTDSKTNLN